MIDIFGIERVFLAVIISAFLSQGIKIAINHIKDKKGFILADLVVTGGMPSTHSALVSSLFGILILETGMSAVSVIAMVLFIIVVTDSMGVRRTAGEEAKMLNKIIKIEKLKIHQLHYALGHKPSQVLAGIALGVFTAIIIAFI